MEATATHTPGPWTAHDDDGTGTLPCVLSKQSTTFGNFYVAQCNTFADARLIAAAPALLAALEWALGQLPEANPKFRDEDYNAARSTADAALRLARGA